MQQVLLAVLVAGIALSITLAQTALAALAALLAWRLATGRARLRGWPLAWPFLAWAAASLASVAAAGGDGLVALKPLLLIAAFYVLLDALPDAGAADRFLAALLGAAGVIGGVGVLQIAWCPGIEAWAPLLGRVARRCDRAHAFFSIYMTLAGVLSLVLLASLPRILQRAGGARGPADGAGARADGARAAWPPEGRGRAMVGLAAGAWAVGAAALGLTFVRGAWLGFLAGIIVVLGLVRRGRLVALAAVALLVLAVFLVPDLRRRAESIVDPADPTARERWAMWASGLAMASDHPLTGIGPGQVRHVYPAYAAPEYGNRRRSHLHSTPIQVLVERGALGLTAWVWIFAAFFWRAARILRAVPEGGVGRALVAGSMAAIAGFLAGGLTEYNFGDSEVALLAYAVMALPFVVARDVGARAGGAVSPVPAAGRGSVTV